MSAREVNTTDHPREPGESTRGADVNVIRAKMGFGRWARALLALLVVALAGPAFAVSAEQREADEALNAWDVVLARKLIERLNAEDADDPTNKLIGF